MRPSVFLTLAWLPVVLLYTDQRASAISSDDLVKVRLPQTSKSCLPPVITTRSVRFYSVTTAGGALYVRHLITQDLLNCLQVTGGAVTETARDFATCANTAEKKKKNVFQFVNSICTTYTAMVPSVLLSPCSGVGDAVVYMAKTALNSVTLSLPKVINLQLTPNASVITASWSVTCNLTLNYNVKTVSYKRALVLSTAGSSFTDSVSVSSTNASVSGSQTTYDLNGMLSCYNGTVTVTPQDSEGRPIGTSMTVDTTTMTGTNTTPTFDSFSYDTAMLDNITVSWNFLGCGSIAVYNFTSYILGGRIKDTMLLNKSVTSLTLLGVTVCTAFASFTVRPIEYNGSEAATLVGSYPFDPRQFYFAQWDKQSSCIMENTNLLDFSAALTYCSAGIHGELFRYGQAYLTNLTGPGPAIDTWYDLQYSTTTSQWVWGNGDVEPTNSTLWATAPDPTVGHCVCRDANNKQKLAAANCSSLNPATCFKFY